jgi:hypothetical protein
MQSLSNAILALATSLPMIPQVIKVEVQENPWVAVAGFVLSIIVAVVQFVGWVLPWMKRRKIIIERVGRIEVVFDNAFGPHLGLHGIISSDNKQSLVTSLRAVVVRTEDNSTRRLDVHLWRDPKITLGVPPQTTSTLAGPFIVPKDGAFGFYGIFVDFRLLQGELTAIINDLQNAWSLIIEEQFGSLSRPQTESEITERRAIVEQVYQKFIAKDATNSASRLSRLYSWFAGNYTLTIECDVRSDKCFRRKWNLCLTAEDEQRLRSNIPNIQRMICRVDASLSPYQVVIAEYVKIT